MSHCKDCAAAWKALGTSRPTGQSIVEHIERMRRALEQISAGEGYYGAQAREYKQIARAALLGDADQFKGG